MIILDKINFKRIGIVIILLIILFFGSVGMGFLVQNSKLLHIFDAYFYTHINGLPHNALTDRLTFPFDLWFLPWKIFFFPAYFYFFFTPFLLFIFLKRREVFLMTCIAMLIGTGIIALLLTVDWHFIFRQRPFVTLPSVHLSEGAKHALMKWPSFPSGHTRDTALFATIIGYLVPSTRIIMIVFSLLIAFLRVYSGEHFPTDVLGGLVLGSLSGWIAILISKEIIGLFITRKQYDKKGSI